MSGTWKIRKIELEDWATEALIHRLQTETNVAVARYYGVAHSTVSKWRERFGIPAFTQGAGKPSAIEAAVLQHMEPGHEYSIQQLRAAVPGSRQQVYEILTRLTTQGTLCRSGTRDTYRWQRRGVPRAEGAPHAPVPD